MVHVDEMLSAAVLVGRGLYVVIFYVDDVGICWWKVDGTWWW